MALICILLVVAQVYFEITIPTYMSELTILLKTPGTEIKQVWFAGLKMLGFTLGSGALAIICGYLSARTAAGLSQNLRKAVFGKVMDWGKQDVQKFSVPSLITRTTNDITQVQMFIAIGLQLLIKSPVMAVWAIIKILGKSWQLSLLTFAAVFLIIITVAIIMSLVLPRFKKVQKLVDGLNRTARENLTGINVVHAYNAENYQNEKFEKVNKELTKTQLFNQRTFAFMSPVMTIVFNGLTLAIYWLGAVLLNKIPASNPTEKLTLFSDIVVFSSYAMYVVMSFMMLIMVFMFMASALVSAKRIREVLETNSSIKEGTVEEGKEIGTVEFRNVDFRYPDSAENQLKDISFKVKKGDVIAFIGSTGCGKTTLISLMARLFDVQSGEVLIDGQNIKDYSFKGLYNKIGYITQKPVIFSGTIRENIDFGMCKNGVRDEDINNALAISEAKEFVDKRAEGVEYHIAQAGKNLSGGQKQRLSISRAIARKPEILIFDDSFSALDYKTDAKVRANLSRELKGATCIIVAQRISTIKNADKIIVLDAGRIVGEGTHTELMDNCAVYKEIALSQLSQKELEEVAE